VRGKEIQTIKLLRTSAALLFVALATGCAFYTSHTVVIEPTVEVPASNIGEGRNVSVYVVDERTKTELGRRAASGGGAITTEQDLAAVFQASIVENLNTMGFNAVSVNVGTAGPGSSLLRVDIRSLEYEKSAGFFGTFDVKTRGAMKVTATRDARSYDHLYRVEAEKNVSMLTPGADSNTQMINAAVSAVLQELFNDVALFRFLTE